MLSFLAWLFVFTDNALASENNLVITEIMYDPLGNNSEHSEWIEIYNSGDDYIFQTKKSGSSYKLVDFYTCDGYRTKKNDTDTDKCIEHSITTNSESEIVLGSKEYVVITTNVDNFEADYSIRTKTLKSSMNLSSSEKAFIKFCFKDDDHCSTVEYGKFSDKKEEGYSLEKIKFSGDDSEENWQKSYDPRGTPGKESSKPKIYTKKIRINEIYPHPDNPLVQDEFVELYNSGDKLEKLTNWRIEDRAGKKCDLSGKEILANGFLLIEKGDANCELALNDTGGEILKLYNPQNKDSVFQLEYTGSVKKGLTYNFDGSLWRWSRFLTPGAENKFNNLPIYEIVKPGKVYWNVYANFSVKAKDPDKDSLKITWDFGDGHKSYLQKTRHKYPEDGTYNASVKIFDGSEEVTGNFSIEVGKFKNKKISIAGFSPNPAGKDSDLEWIEIQNNSGKKVNLKNWSIATGSKKLYNHPITKKLTIESGKSARITRKICKFTLGNKKTKIELRYPDGKVADKVKYDKGKESVGDDEVYEETENGWQWVEALTGADETLTNPVKSDTTSDNGASADETLTDEENFGEDLSEFMGGQSVDGAYQKDKGELLNFGTNIKLASVNYSESGRVLGVSIEKTNPPVYKFTETKPEENKILKFGEIIFSNINLFFNKTINFLIPFL